MRKSSYSKLHFRHPESSDSDAYRVCCSVVDVCVNQKLLEDIRQNRKIQDDGILLCLHWERLQQYHNKSLSTITLGDKMKAVLSSEYPIALATTGNIVDRFARDMLNAFYAKLVAVQYPPFAMVFHHSVDFEVNIFTSDKYKLYGILKALLTEISQSENHIQLSFRINKGAKIRLPTLSRCQCIANSNVGALHKERLTKPPSSTTDASCQTETSLNLNSKTTEMWSVGEKHDWDVTKQIDEKFSSIDLELKEQRKFVEAGLNEQRKQNDELKALLLHITDVMTIKRGEISSLKYTIQECDLMSFSSESGDIKKTKTTNIPTTTQYGQGNLPFDDEDDDDDDDDDDDEDDEDEDDKSDDKARDRFHSSGKYTERKEKSAKNTFNETERCRVHENVTMASTTSENEEPNRCKDGGYEKDTTERRTHEEKKGPIVKENLKSELRSLSHVTTNAEFNFTPSREKASLHNSFNSSDSSSSKPFKEVDSRPQSKVASVVSKRTDKVSCSDDGNLNMKHPTDNRQSDLDGDFCQESNQTADSTVDIKTRSHTNMYHQITTQVRAAALTRPDGREETKRLLAHQTGSLHDFGMNDMMYGEDTYAGDAYADLQSTDLNFAVYSKVLQGGRKTAVSKARISESRLHILIDCMVRDNPNKERLWESIEDALAEDESSLPSVDTGLDTVICLDTSDSMKGEPFQQMKNIVHEFINGIEDIAEQYEQEENLAIVTYGGRGRILHNLSNDYGSLRDEIDEITPGGSSPMLEGVLVALACLSKGGEVDMGNGVRLPPRLIIVTDGLATEELPETAADGYGVNEHQKALLYNAFEELRWRQPQDYLQSQVTVVPVGRSNMSFLLSLAKSCGGTLIEPSKLKKLCNYQRLHKLAAEALEGMKNNGSSTFGNGTRTMQIYLGPDVQQHEMTEVRDIAQDHLSKVAIQYNTLDHFDNIHEVPDLPPLGSRVTRGVDWIWGNQDTEGAGTIFNHGLDGKYVWVLWDNGLGNVYRYGKNYFFDVSVVTDQPRQPSGNDEFCIGLQVKRGPSWHVAYNNQDGGPGNIGVIIREQLERRRVLVRWDSGEMFEYRYGENNMFDLTVIDPVSSLLQATTKP